MAGTAELERQLESVRTLGAVVTTMKTLASVRIGQYRRAVRSLADSVRTLELGFQVLLRERPELAGAMDGESGGPLGALVLGSDRGLCGGFNERIARFASRQLDDLGSLERPPLLLVAGRRAQRRMARRGWPVTERVAMPGSADAIGATVAELLVALDAWREERGVAEVYLFYNTPVSDASYRQRAKLLLPLDSAWLTELRDRPWPTRVLPAPLPTSGDLFRGLLRQQLFVALFRAFAESLASENAARLAAMQAAESSIEQRREELERRSRRERQLATTEELLDIQAGFAALDDRG